MYTRTVGVLMISLQFTASATLTITASYFNDHNDIWEPLIEPLVKGEDKVTYKPWRFDVEVSDLL